MSGLLLGPAERAALAELRLRAEQTPVNGLTLMERLKTPEGAAAHRRQLATQTIRLPIQFTVTFSVESGHPAGMTRHMSMSTQREGRTPNPAVVWMVAEHLGFSGGGVQACESVWLEDLAEGAGKAVNLMQTYATAEAAKGPRH